MSEREISPSRVDSEGSGPIRDLPVSVLKIQFLPPRRESLSVLKKFSTFQKDTLTGIESPNHKLIFSFFRRSECLKE